ncbi:hypothetical protein AL037_06730 [Salipiger aestuarii]|nr:hypothetical protein AL037_06730 [Salipiger aestuarii]
MGQMIPSWYRRACSLPGMRFQMSGIDLRSAIIRLLHSFRQPDNLGHMSAARSRSCKTEQNKTKLPKYYAFSVTCTIGCFFLVDKWEA